MSIEKKSLISTLKTTKKANVASSAPDETGAVRTGTVAKHGTIGKHGNVGKHGTIGKHGALRAGIGGSGK